MAWLNFADKSGTETPEPLLSDMIDGWSIEVMPRTAARIDNFRAILPRGTRVYIAHIDGTSIEDMIATARRLNSEGFAVMPHLPARSITSRHVLEDWLKRYQGEADVRQALLLGGGVTTPAGEFDSSIQMIETGLFDKMGFTRLHVAGHPEGNKDIDRDGSNRLVDEALHWKQDFSTRTDAKMAIVTQFAFDAKSVTAWADRIQAAGITIPIHVGIAGPTKLQTLIKFAISCGVGPSLKVLQKRAMDLSKLLVPYEPTEVVAGLSEHKAANPHSLIEQLHVFPLGGIAAATDWMRKHGSIEAMAAVA
jgi:methylenetetrahydrofolate reductase (NADPH)